MGLIAASGPPEALDLFRKVMFASASVPIAFPPVLFEVEADGRLYDEMHVDGAVAATVFLHGGVFRPSFIRERAGLGVGREDIFVIHNGQLSSESSPTPRSLRGITARVIEVLRPGGGGRGSLYHLRGRAARAGELSLGHDSPGCRDPRRRSLRPGEDEQALRGRLPDRTRRPRLVHGSSGTAGRAFAALTGENASRRAKALWRIHSPAPKVVLYPRISVLGIPGAELDRFPAPSAALFVRCLQLVVAS
jgi:hypothetical protein